MQKGSVEFRSAHLKGPCALSKRMTNVHSFGFADAPKIIETPPSVFHVNEPWGAAIRSGDASGCPVVRAVLVTAVCRVVLSPGGRAARLLLPLLHKTAADQDDESRRRHVTAHVQAWAELLSFEF